jgi:hypothetical protein
MYTHKLPVHLVRALSPPRLATGVLVALALLSAGCGTMSRINAPLVRSNHALSSGLSPAASNFAVLANASVAGTGGSITGDVGTFLATPTGSVTMTGCPITGTVHVGDGVATQAFNDFLNTYAELAPQPGDICTTLTGTLAGVTLAPGVYCFDAAATLTGVLTLDGPSDGIWVFKIGTSGTGALTGTNFSVVMAGGGQASNVTWRVAEAATMTTSAFQGNILARAAITLTGGTFNGNAWSKADVTITGTAVSGWGDSSPQPPPSPPPAASDFAVLANASVAGTGGSITGGVGTFLATPTGSVTMTGCPITGTVHVGDGVATQAFNDFLNTYAELAPNPADVCTTLTGTLAGVTLAPGVYCFDAAATLTGVLTLSGPSDGIWVFKIGASGTGALTGTSFSVDMAGGGQASNVTWWVAQAVTMTDSHFIGTILGGAAITLTRGNFNGNAWSKADVTITGTAVAESGY